MEYWSDSSCLGRDLQEIHINSVAVFILENYCSYEGGVSSRCALVVLATFHPQVQKSRYIKIITSLRLDIVDNIQIKTLYIWWKFYSKRTEMPLNNSTMKITTFFNSYTASGLCQAIKFSKSISVKGQNWVVTLYSRQIFWWVEKFENSPKVTREVGDQQE